MDVIARLTGANTWNPLNRNSSVLRFSAVWIFRRELHFKIDYPKIS